MHDSRYGRSAATVHAELVRSLRVADAASGRALLWFADVLERHLYRRRGHLTIQHYAEAELGFSAKKTEQFVHLARLLGRFPRLRHSLEAGRLGWTKARTLAPVLTEVSEAHWVRRAETVSRRELTQEIRRSAESARRRAEAPTQIGLEPPASPGISTSTDGEEVVPPPRCSAPSSGPAPSNPSSGSPPSPFPARRPDPAATPSEEATGDEVMTSVTLRLRPLERARLERLIETLQKRGHRSGRTALILEALERTAAGPTAVASQSGGEAGDADGGRDPRPRPSHQVVVQLCPSCREASVGAGSARHPLASATLDRLLCDADVVDARGHRRSTIPPATRRRVLARDGHRCTTPGCGATRFLELHHRVPVDRGGTNDPANLVTLCSRFHASFHEIAQRRSVHAGCAHEGARGAVPVRVVATRRSGVA